MNNATDNPFDLPQLDKEDIPVLDDIVVPGSVHENRTPTIPEQAAPGLTDYSFDTHSEPTGEQNSLETPTPEDLAPEETAEEDTDEIREFGNHVALDTGFTIEGQKNEGVTEELHLNQERLAELIDQITADVQQKFEPEIEVSIRQAMEDSLNNALNQQKELIKESVRAYLMERLPETSNNPPAKPED